MKEINANKETLKRNLLDLIELQQILIKAQIFFQEVLNHTHAQKQNCKINLHVHVYGRKILAKLPILSYIACILTAPFYRRSNILI